MIRTHFKLFKSNFLAEHGYKFYELVQEYSEEMEMKKFVPKSGKFSSNQLLRLLLISPLVISGMGIYDNPHANLWCLHAELLAILLCHVWNEDLIYRSKILINQLCHDLSKLYPGCLDGTLHAHHLSHLPDQARLFGSIRNCFGLSLKAIDSKFDKINFINSRSDAVKVQNQLLLLDVSSGMSPVSLKLKKPVYVLDKNGNWYHNVAPLIKDGSLVQDSQERYGFVISIDQENQTVMVTLAYRKGCINGRSYPIVDVDDHEHEKATMSMIGMRVFRSHWKEIFPGIGKTFGLI